MVLVLSWGLLYASSFSLKESPTLPVLYFTASRRYHALEQGYEHPVVILTRNKGYRKKVNGMRIVKSLYRKYPNLQKALSERNTIYNQTMDLIEKMEAEGRITVIRPINPVNVGRMEKDTEKLSALYQEGYDIAQKLIIDK